MPGVLFHFYSILLANSEYPDQTPRSAASDLGLHCLPMSRKWDARLIWVNMHFVNALAESFANRQPAFKSMGICYMYLWMITAK